MAPNPFLLAADNPTSLLVLLRANPSLASQQDDHGYSLVHAAASYNHLDLLRTLVRELDVSPDLRDEDGETALFVVETPEAARVLVEELGADTGIMGDEGMTALEKLEMEGEFPDVTAYLRGVPGVETKNGDEDAAAQAAGPPPLPNGTSLTIGMVDEAVDIPTEVDPEFRRRIDQLAQREDFDSAESQADLRRLVEDVLGATGDRNVRQRVA